MRWVDVIVAKLKPDFGGIPTFCEDPDHLLDLPQVREALRFSGMTLDDWDGQLASLAPLKELGEEEKPLLVIGDGAYHHIVQACLTDFRWETLTIGELMPKFALEVVKSIPTDKWDLLMELHREVRSPRNSQETAILIGRALYGVDPEFLKHGHGWFRVLGSIAVGSDPLPAPIARAISDQVPWPPTLGVMEAVDALGETAVARTALMNAVQGNPSLLDKAFPTEQILVAHLEPATPKSRVEPVSIDLLSEWERKSGSAQDILEFGITYAKAVGTGNVGNETRLELDRRFTDWLKTNYGLMLSAPNPAILRIPTLLERLDKEMGEDRLLLVVVDSLSLRAWERTRERWIADGIIQDTGTRAAFAILPTITSLSRRALFEGKSPSQFSSGSHTPRLERQLWTARYAGAGDYHIAEEWLGLRDSFAKGRRRVCLVDVSWDKRGHSINPRLDSIEEAVWVWAGKTPLREVVREGLAEGYRVILTADHGQVECRGGGRPKVGTLPDERSKRVLVFDSKSVCENFANEESSAFRPSNLPTDTWPLFATGFGSFDIEGAETVSHGGMSIDEVLVPVAEVKE